MKSVSRKYFVANVDNFRGRMTPAFVSGFSALFNIFKSFLKDLFLGSDCRDQAELNIFMSK